MLRILNKFKRDLLSKGRIKSFLFYTVGEVFLVVVGILIALQIDNWNRESQEEKELNEYLLKISENVSSDIELADSLLQRRIQIREICKKGLNAIESGKDKTHSLAIKTINLFADFEFAPTRSGFESLTSSGYIGKLKRSQLDSLLFQYYRTIDDLNREEKSFNGFIESMEIAMNSSNELFTVYKLTMGYEIDKVPAKEAVDRYFAILPFQNALIRGSFQYALTRRYESLLKTGMLLKAEIKAKIKN